eukprot:TRINITY_DN12371_c0_g1_i11.p2 TRINITY_DN12371_c0_g1~~TRINITY_DN12371_c0_g1_i11.p2  ORF type:complete len:106 (-),score=8.50 TRINITY_DN12371_c0_g1_i11:1691-2008(-)
MYSDSDRLEIPCNESMIDVTPFDLDATFPTEVIIHSFPLGLYDSMQMEDVKDSEEQTSLPKSKQIPSSNLTLVRRLYNDLEVTNRHYTGETVGEYLYIGEVNVGL